jgi:hypothetical protein
MTKIIKEKARKDGFREVTVLLKPREFVSTFTEESMYQLPITEEILHVDLLVDAQEVYWCVISQEWVAS